MDAICLFISLMRDAVKHRTCTVKCVECTFREQNDSKKGATAEAQQGAKYKQELEMSPHRVPQ